MQHRSLADDATMFRMWSDMELVKSCNKWQIGLTWVSPKRLLDRFSRLCRAHERDRQTHIQTDHATPSGGKRGSQKTNWIWIALTVSQLAQQGQQVGGLHSSRGSCHGFMKTFHGSRRRRPFSTSSSW